MQIPSMLLPPIDYAPSIAAYAELTGREAASYGEVLTTAVDAMSSAAVRAKRVQISAEKLNEVIADLESINPTALSGEDWMTFAQALRDLEALKATLTEENEKQ